MRPLPRNLPIFFMLFLRVEINMTAAGEGDCHLGLDTERGNWLRRKNKSPFSVEKLCRLYLLQPHPFHRKHGKVIAEGVGFDELIYPIFDNAQDFIGGL